MPRKTEITPPAARASGPEKAESFHAIVRDLQGCPFILRRCLGAREWEFRIETPNGDSVGELYMRIRSGTAQIDHLHVCARGPAMTPRWIRSLLQSLRLAPPTTYYRNRGLGSMLLFHAINAARTHQLNDVVAWIPTGNEHLGWFQKQGFSALALDGGIAVWHETGTPGASSRADTAMSPASPTTTSPTKS